ncbi:MAG TPA: class IV adenylate cyclase [Candidatus Acidoferrales bacterium]|nr:class IV adenylate cyclase [Candidatus Acidoferrales bacterium]
MAMAAQGKEIEIKLKATNVAAARRKLARLGGHVVRRAASGADGRVHEMNTLYDTLDHSLGRNQELMRIRVEGPAKPSKGAVRHAIMTFKSPSGTSSSESGKRVSSAASQSPYKIVDEDETQIDDHEAVARIFHSMGLRPWFRYEKFRTTFALGATQRWAKDLEIDLDETPIGVFLELEGPPKAIDRAAKALGFARSDYITKNYLVLHAEHCLSRGIKVQQVAPGVFSQIPDMLFSSARKSR